MEVIEEIALFGRDGELIPDVFAEEITLEGEELFGAAIEEGEVPVAV